jgi:hypothetical protein
MWRGNGTPQGLRVGFGLKLSVIMMPAKESVKALFICSRSFGTTSMECILS